MLDLTLMSDREFVAGAGIAELVTNPDLPGRAFAVLPVSTTVVNYATELPSRRATTHKLHASQDCEVCDEPPILMSGADIAPGTALDPCRMCGLTGDLDALAWHMAATVGAVVAADLVLTELEKAAAPGGPWHAGPTEAILADWAEPFIVATRLVGAHPAVPTVSGVTIGRLLEELTDGDAEDDPDVAAVAAFVRERLPQLIDRWSAVALAWPTLRVTEVPDWWAVQQPQQLVAVRRSSVARVSFGRFPRRLNTHMVTTLLAAPVLAESGSLFMVAIPEVAALTLANGSTRGATRVPRVMPRAFPAVALAMLEQSADSVERTMRLGHVADAAVAATRS